MDKTFTRLLSFVAGSIVFPLDHVTLALGVLLKGQFNTIGLPISTKTFDSLLPRVNSERRSRSERYVGNKKKSVQIFGQ